MVSIRTGSPLLLLAGFLFAATAHAAPAQPAEKHPTKEESEYFEKRIRPILVKYCYECHAGDPKKAKSNFVLDTRDGLRNGGQSGPVIIPGNADDSPLIEAVRYEGLEMPPKEKLPDSLIDELAKWVEMGAPDPRIGKAANPKHKIDLTEARKYWAFQRPKAAHAPEVADKAWPRTDVDRFVAAAREKEGLQPTADADRATLIRRVTFDLIGLPPTPEEIDAFVNDSSTNALANVVDRLLASPQFGEKWGRHWLDVVRYGESTGKERNIPFRYAWRYRNYVIDAFNEDKPYDRFVVEQIAGDLLPSKNAAEHDKHLIATGFLAIGTKGVNTKDAEQFRYEVIDDQIDVTSRAFLSMTVACARCHDHKFDPIPTSDYYALAGIFRSTDTHTGVKPGSKTASDKALLTLAQAGTAENSAASKRAAKALEGHEERAKEIEKIEAQLAELRKSAKEVRRQAQMKKKKGKGKPQAQTVANPVNAKELRDQIKKLEDRLQQLEGAATPAGDFVMAVSEGKPHNSPLLNRGELKDKGDEVHRGVLSVIKTPAGNVNLKH
ncbi:MAG: DUF1549 domain-containing protein, partial [Planctomycetia bacterium]|nr:DUF1549 domain-containing protein [Planctomycetia bacterium]